MGVIDFLKNVGASIFGKGEDEATSLTNLINTTLPGQITNLRVEFNKGVVDLYGQADTIAAKEKAVLLAGNIKGVEKVNDVYLTAPEAKPEDETVYYEVKPGDSLSKIAKHFYGNAMKYPVIFEANREVIKDPNLIYPGQKLRIPKII